MSSVLYDSPGPVSLRRQRVGSVVGALVLLGLLAAGVAYAAGRGLLAADRWDVLYDPPRNQEAADVWASVVVRGLGATLRAAAVAAPVALALGFLLAVWRTARSRALRMPAVVVVEIFRGLPVLLMMFFALLAFGLSAFQSVVFGLVVYNMAVFAEILRAGLAALPKGQSEAAYAIGLSRGQTLFTILLPQAVRTMLPSLVAQLVVLLKDSALGFIVGYAELLRSIQLNTSFFGERYSLALFLVGTTVYLVVNMTLSSLARRLDRGRGRAKDRQTPSNTLNTVEIARNAPGGGGGAV